MRRQTATSPHQHIKVAATAAAVEARDMSASPALGEFIFLNFFFGQ